MDTQRPKRKVLSLKKEREVKKYRQYLEVVGARGMYPLDAPGMPLPGKDFLRVAHGLGDDTLMKKVAKTKEVNYRPGEILFDLYLRALREPFFTLSVETRAKHFENVVFIPGHVWGENMDSYQQSARPPFPEALPVTGPAPADVMVIGKMPWKDETQDGRNFVGATGDVLIDACCKLHIQNITRWYITNLVKFMPPDGGTRLRADWVEDCLPLLHQELRIVRPRFILFLGAEASKKLLGKKFGVNYMEGRVLPFTFPVHVSAEETPEFHTAQCMTVIHPAQVARDPTTQRVLERGLSRFHLLTGGADFAGEEQDIDHRVCTSLEEAEDWAREADRALAREEPRYRIEAVDAEWQGQHPVNANANVVTIQVSWAHKKAVCFHLRDEENKIVFRDAAGKPALKRLAKLLTAHCNQYRIAGHFFVSDLEMLAAEGFDLRAGYAVPTEDAADGTPAWQRLMNGEGGLDTAMMVHAVEETAQLGLEHALMRYTTVPRYDIALEDEVTALCKKLGVSRAALEGYGKVDRKILIPYANYDADGTRRLAVTLMDYLDSDYEENNCWEPFWESMIIQPILLEIHQNGIYVDRARVDELTIKFITARSRKEEEIKLTARWPDRFDDKGKNVGGFNVRSVQHVKEYLFGHKLNGRVTKDGVPVRIRPEGARCLKVTPLLTTDKPPRRWEEVVAQKATDRHSPSTGKAVLAILAQENPDVAEQINQIRDYRFLDQALKSVLRPPVQVKDDEGHWVYETEDGGVDNLFIYDAGLAACIDEDGMVRTHLYPTAETGRWRSARPNLQNISKTRDPDYFRLLGYKDPETKKEPVYDKKLRSVLMAPPRSVAVPVVKWRDQRTVVEYEHADWVLIEADLKGAELAGMAIMSGSKKMIDHAERAVRFPESGFDVTGKPKAEGHQCAGLDKKGKPRKECGQCGYPHPEFYDIHSNVAKLAFKLDCHPSKYGLAQIDKAHLRNIAKTVIFGLCYGRGAKAIALTAKEQGVVISVEEVEQVIQAVFDAYPELVPFFAECRERALEVGWLCHCYGRFRRFPEVDDYKIAGEFERQAMNFPIQGMIASYVDRWLALLHRCREGLLPKYGEHIFQWQLQMHDALLLRAKPSHVPYIVEELLPWSVQQLPIYPTRLDGSPVNRGPYYLGVEVEVCRHWSERLAADECEAIGVPARFGK